MGRGRQYSGKLLKYFQLSKKVSKFASKLVSK